jgi:hypothetical protein
MDYSMNAVWCNTAISYFPYFVASFGSFLPSWWLKINDSLLFDRTRLPVGPMAADCHSLGGRSAE